MLLFVVCSNFRTILQQDLTPEVCLDYLQDADVLTEEEVGVWAKRGTQLTSLVKIMAHMMEQSAEDASGSKKRKLSQQQQTPEATFLNFCHHYFVVHLGANAESVQKIWKKNVKHLEFPRTKVGDWFNTQRQMFRKRVEVVPPFLLSVDRRANGFFGSQRTLLEVTEEVNWDEDLDWGTWKSSVVDKFFEEFENVSYLFQGAVPHNL